MSHVDSRLEDDSNYLRSIRHQYENLPYPFRDPEDEKTRLIRPTSERLSNLNHYCYRGRARFDNFRVLVAGGGTGDGTTYLATQLSQFPGATVTHLDLSTASIDIARRRVESRGLSNVTFVHGSILHLPDMGFEPFGYVNCTGVLMVMDDPDAGLAAVRSVMGPDSALGLMLYAEYGRTGVYQMQDLLRRINGPDADIPTQLDNAKALLAELPAGNWFKRGEDLFKDHLTLGDSGIYDMFLISCDRAYTVPETYEYVEKAGLHLVDYAWSRERVMLEVESYLKEPALLAKVKAMPRRRQRAIAELMCGTLTRQHVYAAPDDDRVAQPGPDMVPFFVDFEGGSNGALAAHIRANPGQPLEMGTDVLRFVYTPGRYSGEILARMDGVRTVAEIFEDIRASGIAAGEGELMADFLATYKRLNMADIILLRHKDTPVVPEVMHADRPGR